MHEHETDEIGRRLREASAGVGAPASLRLVVGARRAPARRRARGRATLAAAGAAAGAVLLAVVLALSGGDAAPSLQEAAAASLRVPAGAVPRAPDGGLAVRAGSVRFPAGDGRSGWQPTGAATGRVGGRAAARVVYRDGAAVAGYAVLAGAPLEVPDGARQVVYAGVPVAVVRRGGMTIVTWRRGGRTCIVAARGVPEERLLDLVRAA